MSVRKEKKGDPIGSFRDLSSQTRALILYEQGDEHWYKHLGYIDYVVCREGDGILRKGCIYQTNGTHLDSVVIDDCIYPAELLRPAYTHEIAIYKRHGSPVDTNPHPTKDNASTGLSYSLNDKDELLKEARRRYPKGTKFKDALDPDWSGISLGKFMMVQDKIYCELEKGDTYLIVLCEGKWEEEIEEAHSVPTDEWDNYRVDEQGLLRDENGEVMYWEPPEFHNSIHVVSSRPSVIPFKEDKHIEINILKRNINI